MTAESIEAKARRLIATDCVRLLWHSADSTAGRIRGDSGIYDVRWSWALGWSCSCPERRGGCSHIEAVKMLTTRTVRL